MGLAVVVAGVLASVAAPAGALDETIGGFKLGGSGRGWEFTNGPFGLNDASVAIPGRVSGDAFDSPSLELELETGGGGSGFPYSDPDGIGNYNARTNSLSLTPAASAFGLVVSRVETATGPYLRSLIKIHNPTTTSHTPIARWTADFGSDGAEVTQSSSSGDTSFGSDDRWFVSSEPGANAYNDDPVLAFALYGKGVDRKALHYVGLQGPGSGYLSIFIDVKVPAGQTRYLLFFTELHASPAKATASMHKYDSPHLSASLLAGISPSVRSQIVNWDL